jgi:hypothetical protein
MIDLIKLLPYSRNKHYVLFLNNGSESLSVYVNRKAPELKEEFGEEDYMFLPLAEIEASLTPDMMDYMFPWRGMSADKGVEDTFRQLFNVGDRAGLLVINGEKVDFRPVEGDEYSFQVAADELLHKLRIEPRPCFSIQAPEPHPMIFPARRTRRSRAAEEYDSSLPPMVELEPCETGEEPLDEKTQTLVNAWNEFSERYGITIEDLARLIHDNVRLSRLVIKPSGAILLADYGNREVKMDNLTKALYLFYLRHPEGVRQKDLYDHKDEILDIYLRFNNRDDLDELKVSVERLLFDDNRVNVSMSRIKKAFRDVVGDWVAKNYYVDGQAGKARSVQLDRDFVIWER